MRQAQLAKIHLAAKQCGLDDATYRTLLVRVTGKDSAAKMTTDELTLVIAEFARLGFKDVRRSGQKKVWPGEPKNLSEVPMLSKVQALLANAKRPWSYAHNTAKQMFKIDRVEFLNQDQLHRLVAALQVDANRGK
ncbi:regulatory protein GemA [Xanthomonas melonis]|uniref:gp16 family protein n=1 Tax=Xanthomonas melonis TaxID=56456 RepID=UPI001E4D092F|nr:regulatory protein GemA [Xanthomonas melonis]MCD0281291.1 regulatory protein GemA [Xanthomonas melonis]